MDMKILYGRNCSAETQKFPIISAVLTVCEICIILWWAVVQRNAVASWKLESLEAKFMLTAVICIITAWMFILRSGNLDTDDYLRSPIFPVSIVVPYIIMASFGYSTTHYWGELDWYLEWADIHDPLLNLLNKWQFSLECLFPLPFKCPLVIYAAMLALIVLFIWLRNRKKLANTIPLILIHPMFLMIIFRMACCGLYSALANELDTHGIWY